VANGTCGIEGTAAVTKLWLFQKRVHGAHTYLLSYHIFTLWRQCR